MKKTILTLLIALAIVACSKEDIKKMEGKVDVTVYLKDANGTPLKNWVVYAYDQWAWENKGSSRPTFHAKSAATDDEGKAIFTLSVDKFEEREVYHFVVYYTQNKKNLSGDEVTENTLKTSKAVTLKSKDNAPITLQL
nr:hypothetical protein [uncultured Capnocytophaga sp.]